MMLLLMPPFKINGAKYLASQRGKVYDFVEHYAATGSIGRLPGSGCMRESKVTGEITKIR